MDEVRALTARMTANQKIDTAQEAILKKVYLNLEEYLTTREPVRKFTKDSLRQHIQHKLHLAIDSRLTFWSQLDAQPVAQQPRSADEALPANLHSN